MSVPESDGIASDIEIPDKVFFRIGEVSRLTGGKAYVLRFWETEFASLKPQKGKTGQRRYRRSDIEQILRVKELLWERKFTIAGARSELRGGKDRGRTQLKGQQALPIVESAPVEPGPSTLDGYSNESLRAMRHELVALRQRVRELARDTD